MRKKLLFLMCCMLAILPAMGGQKKVFTVASLNVDGLPPTVKVASLATVKLNPEGPQEAGTLQISKLVSQKRWDFFSVSEDFNYHDQLMTSISGIYSTGTYRGKIDTTVGALDAASMLNGNKWFDTDGLNLLWRAGISATGEKCYLWDKRNGTTSDGADQLIAKGFRYYKVTVGNGMDVDVYILHMDAETTEKDNAARVDQMRQLSEVILASNNGRPIIIMGDTNCRYTRDPLKSYFFKLIDDDPRFTIHDPWIDFSRKGVYPPENSSSIMVQRPYDGTEESYQNFQTGEVVDKIWWIENTDSPCKLKALSYLHDTDFTWPDGSEISDHYPIVIDFEIERVREDLADGQFYFRNVGTGKYMAAGHNYGTKGIVNKTGISIALQAGSTPGTFRLSPSSMHSNDGSTAYLGADGYIDNPTPLDFNIKVAEGTNYYTIVRADNGQAVAPDGNDNLAFVQANASDKSQQWELIGTDTRLENLKTFASESDPMDATFLIPGYSMPRNDTGSEAWIAPTSAGSKVNKEISSEDNATCNSVAKIYNNEKAWYESWKGKESAWSLTRTISGLPNGTYDVGCNIMSDHNDATLSFNGISVSVPRASETGTYSGIQAGKDFDEGKHQVSTMLTITNNQLTVVIAKPGDNTSAGAVIFDNFFLTYYGPTAADLAAIDRVKAAIDDAQAKADEEGYTDYSNRAVENAWENRLVSGNGDTEVHNTYIALAKASTKQRKEFPVEMRYAILNNSFEMGDLTEWKNNATNAKVVEDAAAADGKYLFKADGGSISYSFEVTMPNGIYELTAYVTPGTVLTAGAEKSAPAVGNDGQLVKTSVKFMISGGTATVGAENGNAFMADDFRVTRLTDHNAAVAINLIRIAMADAGAKISTMGAPYSNGWTEKMAPYQALVDKLEVSGNGEKEFVEIYDLLREQVYLSGNDFTNAIINPSFELNSGSTLGWSLLSTLGDTGARDNNNDTYKVNGADGSYVFNTWDQDRGTILSQAIHNLPAGHYQLRATIASDKGNYVYLEAKGQDGVESQKEKFQCANEKGTGQVVTFEFEVADGTPEVIICAGGCNGDGTDDDFGGKWYKIDNFKLVRTGDPNNCFFYARLENAINEANRVAAKLPEKYSSQWDAHDYQDLYDRHIASDHQGEDEIGSGLDEINELFQRLRDLIFSQTESEADMSGAITNNSFEMGDLTGWTTDVRPQADAKVTKGNNNEPYTTVGVDGEYLFNNYYDNTATPIWQIVPDVPAGIYVLTVKFASDAGGKFFLGANEMHSEVFTVEKFKEEFADFSFQFEITEKQDVKLGVYPTIDDSFDFSSYPTIMGQWYKVDDFRLNLIGRNVDIEWEMETDTHGTIILPFDVDAETLAEKKLEVYAITSSHTPDTPAEDDVNKLYRVLNFQKQDMLHANVPYILKNIATAQTSAPRKEAAMDGGSNRVYTFSGQTSHKQDQYVVEGNLLTGTLVEVAAGENEHHFQQVGENVGFMAHSHADENGVAHQNIQPYHAYIFHPWAEVREIVLGFYFDEPVLPIEWTMEGANYGTIILPFDAEIPAELSNDGYAVYELTALGEKKDVEGESMTYQVIQKTEVSMLQANVPYMVLSAKASKPAETPSRIVARAASADDSETEAKVPSSTFTGQATNSEVAYDANILTGVFKTTQLESGDHVLSQDENTGGFAKLEDGQTGEVPAYHAYVKAAQNDDANNVLVFDEPEEEGGTTTGINDVLAGKLGNVDIYDLSGVMLIQNANAAEALRSLDKGIYIIRLGEQSFKVMK